MSCPVEEKGSYLPKNRCSERVERAYRQEFVKLFQRVSHFGHSLIERFGIIGYMCAPRERPEGNRDERAEFERAATIGATFVIIRTACDRTNRLQCGRFGRSCLQLCGGHI